MKTKEVEKLLFLILGIFLISFTSALDTQGVGIQGENFTFVQTCADATYITLSSVQYPNRTVQSINTNMTSIGGGAYQYNFTDVVNGRYDVTGISDGCEKTFATYFEVTPSGREAPTSGEGTIFLSSLIAMLLIATLFFSISIFVRENEGLRFAFVSLSVITSLIVVLYSSVALMEVFWGFDKSNSSYSTFLWIFLFLIFIIFIFILISLLLKAVDSMKSKRGLNET